MLEEVFFKVKNEKGEWVEYEMLDAFLCDATGKNYILYTDNTFNEEQKMKVYASVYDPQEYEMRLYPIDTEEEWRYVHDYLISETLDAECM